MNGLSNLGETFREYLLSPTNDPIRCWRSKVNRQSLNGPSRWRMYPCRRLSIEVHLLVLYIALEILILGLAIEAWSLDLDNESATEYFYYCQVSQG